MKRKVLTFLTLIFIVFALASCGQPQNVEDTGETVEGTYVWSVSIGVSLESSWTFEDRTVTNRYYNGLDYVEDTYNYVIGLDNGVKVIRLTSIEGFVSYEYEFEYGNGYVMIAGERYESPEE